MSRLTSKKPMLMPPEATMWLPSCVGLGIATLNSERWFLVDTTSKGVERSQGLDVVHDSSRWCGPTLASPGITRCLTTKPFVVLGTASMSSSSKNTFTVAHVAANVVSRNVIAMPGGPDDGDERRADVTFSDRCASAEALPL